MHAQRPRCSCHRLSHTRPYELSGKSQVLLRFPRGTCICATATTTTYFPILAAARVMLPCRRHLSCHIGVSHTCKGLFSPLPINLARTAPNLFEQTINASLAQSTIFPVSRHARPLLLILTIHRSPLRVYARSLLVFFMHLHPSLHACSLPTRGRTRT